MPATKRLEIERHATTFHQFVLRSMTFRVIYFALDHFINAPNLTSQFLIFCLLSSYPFHCESYMFVCLFKYHRWYFFLIVPTNYELFAA